MNEVLERTELITPEPAVSLAGLLDVPLPDLGAHVESAYNDMLRADDDFAATVAAYEAAGTGSFAGVQVLR